MNKFFILTWMFVLFFGCKTKNERNPKELVNINQPSSVELKYDDELLDKIQRQTFNYFWDGAEPNSGFAPERLHMDDVYPTSPKNTVTTGGTGFGMMAILVGVERNFITRDQAFRHFQKMISFLEKADRFHGAWPHWLNGETGKVYPFSKNDDGGDLVETAFLIQGMLTVAEYFRYGSDEEQKLVERIEKLWHEVEWDWYTQGRDVLYWHWSPKYKWEKDFAVGGYNECLIMYVLAAASPTYSISKEVYHRGWARNDSIISNESLYEIPTILNYYEHNDDKIGPLFWAHYSYLGLNPKGLKDKYADYWELTRNHAKIHHKHSIVNPNSFEGYGDSIWGLTSSYSMKGYKGHRPERDLGVISPTAALSSFPYTPEASMKMLKKLYKDHDTLIGKYGPYDAFSFEHNWYTPRYLAIDQGPIPVMIENHRTGLLWELFMKNKDVQKGLEKLGFSFKKPSD